MRWNDATLWLIQTHKKSLVSLIESVAEGTEVGRSVRPIQSAEPGSGRYCAFDSRCHCCAKFLSCEVNDLKG